MGRRRVCELAAWGRGQGSTRTWWAALDICPNFPFRGEASEAVPGWPVLASCPQGSSLACCPVYSTAELVLSGLGILAVLPF